MKLVFIVLMLLSGVAGELYAQQANSPLWKDEPDYFVHSIFIELEDGNTLRIDEYGKPLELHPIDIDSLIGIMQTRIREIADSLAPAEYVRTVTIDLYGDFADQVKFINLSQEHRYLLHTKQERSFIKMEQDTIVLNAYSTRQDERVLHQFYRVSFYLNDIGEIANYGGRKFTALFKTIEPEKMNNWRKSENGFLYMKSNPSIQQLQGYQPHIRRSAMKINFGLSVQNYGNYLPPSYHLALGISTEKNYLRDEYWLGSETYLIPGRTVKGDRKIYSNSFIYLAYKHSMLNASTKHFVFFDRYISLGYLTRSKGDIFDKHSFRLGLGQIYLGKKSLRVEPGVFFHDWGKDGMLSLRVTQSF